MRRVTSFCVLVASMLILIQGARSEHAFRQNDRPPNALERDADKYNKPQIPSKLPINQLDQTDACPTTEKALVESVQTTEKGIDSATVLPPCTKRVVAQNSATRYRRRVNSSPVRRHRRKETYTRDVARQTASRRHRRRDLSSTDTVRRTTARRHRRKYTATRNASRQTATRRDRRLDHGIRDAVRHRLVLRQRQDRHSTQHGRESRQVRRTLSPDSRRSIRRMVDVSVRSRFTAHRDVKRERNSRLSRRDVRNTRSASNTRQVVRDYGEDILVMTSPYQHKGEVDHSDRSYTTSQDGKEAVMHFTRALTNSRSSRNIRRNIHRSQRDRHLSIKAVSDAGLYERRHRIDVRRRFRHSERRASGNTRRDVTKGIESVRVSVPYHFNTVSVIDQLTMQASKECNRNSFNFRSDKRIARRTRLTRGYRRIPSNDNGLKRVNKVDSRDTNLENVEKSEIEMPSERHISLNLDGDTTKKSVIKDNSAAEDRNTNGNRVILQRRRRQENRHSRSRMDEKRRVSRSVDRSRRSDDAHIRQGSRPAYSLRNTRRERRNGRSARRHLRNTQHRARALKRSSNDNATRRSVPKEITDNQNNLVSDVTRVSTEHRNRNRQIRRRERSSRRVRRLRVARGAGDKNLYENEITDYRTFTGGELQPSASRQQMRTYRYLTPNYRSERRSRRNSRMESRRTREVRSRRARQRSVERTISEYDSTSHFGLTLFNSEGSTRKAEAVVRGMARSRRSRHSERRGKLPLNSQKTLVVTTKSLDIKPPNTDVHVDQSYISGSEQHILSKLSGAVGYYLNLIFSCTKGFQNDDHSEQGAFPDDAHNGMDSCTRGVMLGVVSVLGTQVVQAVSAPSLPLGRIKHSLLA